MRQTCRLSFVRLLTLQLHSGLPPARSIIMPSGCPCRPCSGHCSFSHLHCFDVVANKKVGKLLNGFWLVSAVWQAATNSSLGAGLNQTVNVFILQVYFVLKALNAHNHPLSCQGTSFVPDQCARLHHGDHLAPVTPRDSKAVFILKAPAAKFWLTAQVRLLLLDLFGFFWQTTPKLQVRSVAFSGSLISHGLHQCHMLWFPW